MLSSGHSQHRFHLPIGTIALLLAIIAWGFHYKISLYQEQHELNTNITPPAKLLSEAEKSAISRTAAISPDSQLRTADVHFFAAGFDVQPSDSAGVLSLIAEDDHSQKRTCWRFFLRPPPLA